ncbi:MAG: hypothetical protein BWY63_03727 [Chloroflexi bacterium ADurb.Bin360]|nr:MAG: hypothetical protein BWY63_03727 [Chloroflexi bacterium ADurb.Bin360]
MRVVHKLWLRYTLLNGVGAKLRDPSWLKIK